MISESVMGDLQVIWMCFAMKDNVRRCVTFPRIAANELQDIPAALDYCLDCKTSEAAMKLMISRTARTIRTWGLTPTTRTPARSPSPDTWHLRLSLANISTIEIIDHQGKSCLAAAHSAGSSPFSSSSCGWAAPAR